MEYKKIKYGIFKNRPNRFIANVIVDEKEEVVHVKNTGRCKELLVENAKVILEESDNLNRKTKYSLVSVYKDAMLVNMDSQAPNSIVFEAMESGVIKELGNIRFIKREATYSKSRFDFYFESDKGKGYLEVKGVTLENNGLVSFPDAPTQRGKKHVMELIEAKKSGYYAGVLFLVQMKGSKMFSLNDVNDPEFSNAVRVAAENGVEILCYDCIVKEDTVVFDERIDIDLKVNE